MRVWDIPACYLNRGSLLGEHREIHAIHTIITQGKRGYSSHPETLRWKGHLPALALRHRQIAIEMELRGYKHNSEIPLEGFEVTWPETFIDEPSRQYELLKDKYIGKQPPPIPLPSNNRDLWKQHKFSILARDEKQYREIGPQVAGNEHVEMKVLAHKLTLLLRTPPSSGGLSNALDHMWGFLKKLASSQDKDLAIAAREAGSKDYLRRIREGANIHGVSYILESTALYELDCWHE